MHLVLYLYNGVANLNAKTLHQAYAVVAVKVTRTSIIDAFIDREIGKSCANKMIQKNCLSGKDVSFAIRYLGVLFSTFFLFPVFSNPRFLLFFG